MQLHDLIKTTHLGQFHLECKRCCISVASELVVNVGRWRLEKNSTEITLDGRAKVIKVRPTLYQMHDRVINDLPLPG